MLLACSGILCIDANLASTAFMLNKHALILSSAHAALQLDSKIHAGVPSMSYFLYVHIIRV